METLEALKTVDDIAIYREGETDLESFESYQKDPLQFHLRAFRKFGPIYQTHFRSQRWVVLAGLEANDFVWKNTRLWSYQDGNAPFLEEMGPDHVTALDGDHHRQKRKILKPSFDQGPAMRFLPQFNQMFGEELKTAAAAPTNDLMKLWADIITKINSKTVAQADIPDDVIRRMARWEFQMLHGLFLEKQRPAYIGREEYRELKAEVLTWLGRIVDERLAHPGKYDDNFEMTIRARAEEEEGKPDRDRLINDLYLVLMAGTDNTADLINWALQLTIADPGWLAELREELAGWDSGDVMGLAKMPKLKATIMETQRLRPGVLLLTKHAAEAFEFSGYRIPANSKIIHVISLGHILEECYPDPLAFKPQRFLEGGKFVPRSIGLFGGGTHICLGRNHSLMQSPVVVAQVLKNYDLTYQSPPQGTIVAGTTGARREREIWARLTPRVA
jgi:cytochrome P450